MFDKFIGQQKIVKEISAILHGLKTNEQESVNILFRGPAGCGKTTLAKFFCYELVNNAFSYQIPDGKILMTPNISKLRAHIVDEVHMARDLEEFYPLMDGNDYTFLFCTTEAGDLPDPFISRCITLNFEEYTDNEICTIIVEYGREIGFIIDRATAQLVAKRARGSPRVAKKYLKRIKFIIDRGYHPKTVNGIIDAFEDIGILKGGYTDLDMKYLKFLANQQIASLATITRGISVDEETVKNTIEPFLLDKGHISISNRGRKFIGWGNGEVNE
jgi:Holliday junction DNA helicase RuvB